MRSLMGIVVWTVTLLSSAMARADNWTSAARLSEAREGLGAVGLPNGRVVAFGGHRGSMFFTLAEIYDPATNAWFPLASMPTPRAGQASGLPADGRVFVPGGGDGGGNADSFFL